MFIWTKWRNPIAVFTVSAMLTAAAILTVITASDLNEASDASVQIGALSKAAADLELAWFQAMGADALAATGQAPDEAQGFYEGAINLYDSSKVVLAAAGIPEINQALAASDQGLAGMTAAFAQTMALAPVSVEQATQNHLAAAGAIYNSVDPAVKGLAQVAQAADAHLVSEMNSGATKLRIMAGLSFVIAAAGAAFAGWSAWSIYRREDDESAAAEGREPESYERAA